MGYDKDVVMSYLVIMVFSNVQFYSSQNLISPPEWT